MRVIQKFNLDTEIASEIYYYENVQDLSNQSFHIKECINSVIARDKSMDNIFIQCTKEKGYDQYINFMNYVDIDITKKLTDSILEKNRRHNSGWDFKIVTVKMPEFEPKKFKIGCYNVDVRYLKSHNDGLYVIISITNIKNHNDVSKFCK